jgi:hypothetical protein
VAVRHAQAAIEEAAVAIPLLRPESPEVTQAM